MSRGSEGYGVGSGVIDSPPAEVAPLRCGRVACVAVGFLLLSLVPFLLGWAWAPEGQVFLGTRSVNAADVPTNLARVEQVRAGAWLIKNPYALQGDYGLFRPTYVLTGLVARVVGTVPALHLTRVLFGALFLVALYRLAALVFPDELRRWLALALGALGSGLSWLGAAVRGESLLLWPDAIQPEVNVFASLLEQPHFAFSLWLLVELVIGTWRALAPDEPQRGRALAAACAAACFGLFDHPYNAATAAVLVGLLLVLAKGQGAPWRRVIGCGAAILIASLVPVTWLAVGLHLDPSQAQHAQNNLLESPGPFAYLMAFGLLWPFALTGSRTLLAQRSSWVPFLSAWALLPWALIYLPVSFQRRMVEGWQIPLALLAAARLAELWREGRRGAALLLTTLMCIGTPVLVGHDLLQYWRGSPESYVERARWEGWAWLRGRVDSDDGVLASVGDGLWIPALTPCRVAQGRSSMGRLTAEQEASLRTVFEEAASTKRPPSFPPAFGTVRFVITSRGLDGVFGCRLGELVVEPRWAEPVFANEAIRIYALPH